MRLTRIASLLTSHFHVESTKESLPTIYDGAAPNLPICSETAAPYFYYLPTQSKLLMLPVSGWSASYR